MFKCVSTNENQSVQIFMKKKLKPWHTCCVFVFCWEGEQPDFFSVSLLQWMNEMELVTDQRAQNWEYSRFNSYLVSAICKTLLNAESDAKYWIVSSSLQVVHQKKYATEDFLVLQVGLMKWEKGCHSGFHSRTTWVCVPALPTTLLLSMSKGRTHPVLEGVPHLKRHTFPVT